MQRMHPAKFPARLELYRDYGSLSVPPPYNPRCSAAATRYLAFTLRAVELVIADQSPTDREIIRRLWDILSNNPHLIKAMWPQNSPFGPTWLSVRPAPGYVGTQKATARP